MFAGPNRRAAVGIGVPVLLALWAAKDSWDVPARTALLLGGLFVLWSAVFWGTRREAARPGWRIVAAFLAGFAFLATLPLVTVYHLDRGRWVWFELTGYDLAAVDNLAHLLQGDAVDCANRYPWLSIDPQDNGAVVVREGVHHVSQTAIIPENVLLKIEPGAVLRFGGGCSLVCHGPVQACGTPASPIAFTANHPWQKWGVVAVIGAESARFEHAQWKDCRHAVVNGISLVGGLTLIETDATVVHCQFSDVYGKDALNARDSRVLLTDNLFCRAFKDGVDFDGGCGEISRNRFVDCNDEGIDLTEDAQVRVLDNTILDSRGGRIAAGARLEEFRASNVLGYSGTDREMARRTL